MLDRAKQSKGATYLALLVAPCQTDHTMDDAMIV